MSEILLVNPRKRRAKRKMSAKQAKYFGKRRKSRKTRVSTKRRHVARRRNPAKRRAVGKRRPVMGYAIGKRRIRRRRMNPSFRGMLGGAVPMVKDGLVGAVGALGLDMLWGYGKGYLPASIAGSPIAQYAVKLAGALAVGVIGNKVMRGRGRAMAVGATTVVLHDALKAQLQASFPALPLGEYLTYAPTVGTTRRAGRILSTGMGEYLSGLPDHNLPAVMDSYDDSGDYSGDGRNGAW